MTLPIQYFYTFAAIVLGALNGFLIAFPLSVRAVSEEGGISYGVVLLGIGMGALIGYRKRVSRAFLYVSMLTALCLAMLVSTQMT
jgi:hypothetical protein